MKPNPVTTARQFLGMISTRRAIAAAIAAVVAGGAAVAVGMREPAAAPATARPAAPSITVNVISPEPTSFDRALAASGTVMARDELVIGSDAAGVRLTAVLVEVGSVVRKGDLLARGDDAQLRAQLAQQVASLKNAQADHAQAEINLERTERLKDSGVYSLETMQTRRTAAASSAARVELAQAQLRELEVRLAQTRVVAPAAGVISKKLATVGAVVQPGNELFRLIRDGELEWLAELPSHSIASITPGTSARVLLDDGRTIDAKVRLVEPTMDTTTRNGLVHVMLPHGAPVKAGQHARGEILTGNARGLALPESSVMMRDGYAFVFKVGADNVARLVKIETGARRNGLVEVSAGVDTQAHIVGTGAGFVKDGDLVRVAPASAQRVARAGERS
jgi:RND family efflux transporter MFP subunit